MKSTRREQTNCAALHVDWITIATKTSKAVAKSEFERRVMAPAAEFLEVAGVDLARIVDEVVGVLADFAEVAALRIG